MTIEELKKINRIAEDLEVERIRVKELNEMKESGDAHYFGADMVAGEAFGCTAFFNREHFDKFLEVEIMRAENTVKRLSNELQSIKVLK